MNLRKKSILFFLFFIFLWIVIMQYVIPVFIMDSFNTIEKNAFDEKMLRVERTLNSLLLKHDNLMDDWSKWTDAFNFVENPSGDFITQNINPVFFNDQEINYAFIFDRNNELVFASGYDFELNLSQKVPGELVDIFKFHNEKHGLIYLKEKAYIFSKSYISNSDLTRTSKGSFVFASELELEDIGHLGDDLQENLFVSTLYASGKTREISKSIFENDFEKYVIYKIPYTNLDAHLEIKLDLPKDISEIGEKAIKEGLLVFAISAILLCVFMFLVINHLVIRILKLNNDVILIRRNNDTGLRVKASGNDELRTLQDNINEMLDHIDFMNQELNKYATYDLMTGALNRRSGFDRLEKIMKKSQIAKIPITISFLDINNLKSVNDTYGHNEGDYYIKNVCTSIQNNIRKFDIFFRLGGDEFLIVFINCDFNSAKTILDRIKSDLTHMASKLNRLYDMSISNGIVEYDHKTNITQFIELADKKMYEDKKKFKST